MEGALDHRSSAKDSRALSDDIRGLAEGTESSQTRPTERPSAPRLPHVPWTASGEAVRIQEVRANASSAGELRAETNVFSDPASRRAETNVFSDPASRRAETNVSSHERATPKVPAFDHELFEGVVPEVPRIPRMTPPPQSGIVATVTARLSRTADVPFRAVREEMRVTRRDPRAEEDD